MTGPTTTLAACQTDVNLATPTNEEAAQVNQGGFRENLPLYLRYHESFIAQLRDMLSGASDTFLNSRILQYYVSASSSLIDMGLGGGSGFGGSSPTALDSTTWAGRQQGLEYSNAGASSLAGLVGASQYFRVGSAADGGGIDWGCFGRLGSTFRTTAGALSGLTVNTGAMTTTPGTASNFGFMGAYIDAGQSNWRLGVRDRAGSVNFFDTGIAWATNQHYQVRIAQPKGNAANCVITFKTRDATTGAIASSVAHTFTSGFPASSDGMEWTNTVASSVGADKIQFFRCWAIIRDVDFT